MLLSERRIADKLLTSQADRASGFAQRRFRIANLVLAELIVDRIVITFTVISNVIEANPFIVLK